jgi:hypothetical protein
VYYQAWIALQKKPKKGQPVVPKAESGKPEAFSVARVGHQRRVTSIPNPITQTYLATHVQTHWGSFVKRYRQSRLSASPKFLLSAWACGEPNALSLLSNCCFGVLVWAAICSH